MCQHSIANIDINKDYDESLGTEEVHYQSFSRMAAFLAATCRRIATTAIFRCTFLIPGRLSCSLMTIATRCRRRCLL